MPSTIYYDTAKGKRLGVEQGKAKRKKTRG